MMQNSIGKAIIQQGLNADFNHTVERWYRPLAQDVASCARSFKNSLVLGVQGCQGSGKSTLASFLKILLEQDHQLRVATVSLDDFYLTLGDRQRLARAIHPLLRTRGVPGTHDLPLAEATFSALLTCKAGEQVSLPRFDKARDDRAPRDTWPTASGPIDVLIFEGWCVAAPAQNENELIEPLNDLEKYEDPQGLWRTYVNEQLKRPYASLFARISKLAVLNAPSFDCVYAWRSLQEQKLAQKILTEKHSGARVQTAEELRRFISHYERLTRHCLKNLPAKADWLLPLNSEHEITELITR